MATSTSDFINKLAELKKDFKVFIPSLKKETTAKQITLKQQKDIISTAINGVLGALQFTKSINDVIIDNIDSDEFYTFDRVPALLALRIHSLGDKIKAENGEIVSLKPSLQKAKKVPTFKLDTLVHIDNIKVNLRIPTLKEENVIVKRCIQEIDNLKSEDLSEAMGLIYIFELLKTIKSITVEEETVEFNDLKVTDRVKIIEQLPLELYEDITAFLDQLVKYESSLLSIDDTSITIDASLFDATPST
jgi:hypothetical protein|tara:strand:- start:2171 stop:2911 length:741 start_codon:yes stop_codon:yes gene_type:complete